MSDNMTRGPCRAKASAVAAPMLAAAAVTSATFPRTVFPWVTDLFFNLLNRLRSCQVRHCGFRRGVLSGHVERGQIAVKHAARIRDAAIVSTADENGRASWRERVCQYV